MLITNIKTKGMTLIELIITIAIFAIVIQVIYSIFILGNKSYNTSTEIGFAQQEIRNSSIALSNEIKTAKNISISDISGNKIEIVDNLSENASYLNINNQTFGPFELTSFIVSSTERTLEVNLIDKLKSNVSETITVYFENWDSFENKIDMNSKIIYYTKYE